MAHTQSLHSHGMLDGGVADIPEPPVLFLSVVMPCLNEERTVGICVSKAVAALARLGVAGEVLVVDNGSTDRSVIVARLAGARVVFEPERGYGNAVRRGFDEARGRYLVMGDCDESYDFDDISAFIERLALGADVVIGNRYAGGIKPGAMPWLHRWIGNPALSHLIRVMYCTPIGDSQCGMRGLSMEAYRRLRPRMPGMEFASEMLIRASLARLRIEEVPVVLSPDRRDRAPHLRTFRDGWRHLRFMLLCSPLFLFLLPGLFITAVALAAIPAAVLAGYGKFTGAFGPNFMYAASLCAICGSQLMVFALLAKLYAGKMDAIFQERWTGRIASWFSVERGLIAGAMLIIIATCLGLPVVFHWLQNREVPSSARWILAGAFFVLGVEVIFSSFLVGIIETHGQSGKARDIS